MKRIVALVSAGLLLVLTGCSQVNSAATVGSDAISIATVQKSVDAILAERSKVDTTGMTLETGDVLARSELRFHLISLLLADVAVEKKLTVTASQVTARRASIVAQVGGEASLPKALVGAGIASSDFNMYLNSVLYSEALTKLAESQGATTATAGAAIQSMVVSTAGRLKVTVNPRYGKWDPIQANIVAADATKGAVTTK
ncbi:MAG: hypothetical protein WCP64_05615 [Actinomycetes bacterium]